MTLLEGAATLGTCDLAGAVSCTLTKSDFTAGSHTLSARYSGDTYHSLSTASGSLTVNTPWLTAANALRTADSAH